MIYDSIENLKRYYFLGDNFIKAAEFLKSSDLCALPIGKTEILGEEVYVNVAEIETGNGDCFEWHRRYADLQIDLIGEETIAFSTEITKTLKEYCEDGDYGLAQCENPTFISPSLGKFALFFANELHSPNLINKKAEKVKKCVFKIKL